MEGMVLKSTGSWYQILGNDHQEYRGRIRGKLRLEGLKSTNPIAVGDYVEFELETPSSEPDLVIIKSVLYRRNYIIRKSNNLSRQTQIIAANMDMVALVVTLAEPATSTGFIDRFLVTAEAYHIPALLVFNKIDQYGVVENAMMKEYQQMYGAIGYNCIEVSALKGDHMEDLRNLLKNKTTLFSGHSGVGKSTLLNALHPEIGQRTGEISDYSGKGKHTTTFAEMFVFADNMRLIDTPGIKDFGVVNLEKNEIAHYFPEMRQRMKDCRFNDCIHMEEPGCAILEAVESGAIHPARYRSYVSILLNEDVHH